jgi:hypothetical protein
MTSVDDVFRGFCQACVSARDECPLAGDLSAEQLEEMLYDYFETLRFNPVPLLSQNFPGGGLPVDYSIIKGSILALLNFPSAWPLIANGIAATIAGSPPLEIAGEVPPQDALSGIKCSDVLTRLDNYTDWSPQAEARLGLSRFAGDLAWEVAYRCGQWKLPAKERYDGDFRVRTKNPVLLIGNTFDPVTPLVSARNVSETLEGSVLLQQDSYGVG